MNLWDILILLAVAACVLLALRTARRGTSRCGGCCADCGQRCDRAERTEDRKT